MVEEPGTDIEEKKSLTGGVVVGTTDTTKQRENL